MSIHKTEAIVLRRRDFRETSLIVDFYTRAFGKISGILKGIRLEPDKFASTVEVSSYNDIIFYKKPNTSLYLVSGCDLKDKFFKIRNSIIKAGISSFMMELISTVMQPEEKNEDIFNLALNCLKELEVTHDPEKVMIIFKIKMLALSGFKPHFDSCVSCANKILGQSKFSLCLGGLLCPECYYKDLSARSIFRGTVASILHIERTDFKANLNLGLNPQIKKELRIILNSFLNFHLERELNSQKVLNKLAMTVWEEREN
ncbi:MAG: DNA repair protein RecO [Candidatus Omnitrophica bacterium CG08_land_8_20_14_0_20_41_16]|uniref:DNA repair protein RecO n=1 Tax=Candidatus Sherwoodlollariibacterium unditelluris TaxID=1974757 RepID=A0A2G9YH67_9BACT|nr:MAG: DNA repair protein RecO [Candidatus Omnitrophica bacterium CG23_combo_of_CG06-09_8_20_14_all_41_10]PIS33992.1 MAG: DNA repair protein RecO [Candidatus Omnitrophica bacterium CG08_land_8_20_14_0_20_41_16]